MLDYRIETFICVYEELSYTKASQKLNITQPAASQHIKFLEEKYNAKLFEYSGRRLIPTTVGKELYYATKAIQNNINLVDNKINELVHKKQRVDFGATFTIGEFVLPKKVARIIKNNPDIDMKMVIYNTHILLDMLDNGQIKFALIEGYFLKNKYESRPYSTENYIAVCSPEYRFSKEIKNVKDLFEERLIVRENGSGTREVLERYLNNINCGISDFKYITEINRMNAIKELVIAKAGITFLYESAVKRELEDGLLTKIELADMDINHEFSFVWTKDNIYKDELEKWLELLK